MPIDLYHALIRPLRDADAETGRLVLERYLRGPQAVQDAIEAVTRGGAIPQGTRDVLASLGVTLPAVAPGLRAQLDPARTDAALLRYLKDIVGLTRELDGITTRLSTADLRRLIRIAVAMWKERHTPRGIVNAIRLLTGRPSLLTDWFGFRWLLGETQLGEEQLVAGGDSWIIGGATSVYDEYWSNIRVMDDGTLDELLLIDVLRLNRPISERIEVLLCDFIDAFDLDLSLWAVLAGAAPTLTAAGEMAVPSGTEVEAVVPIVPAASLLTYVLILKLRFAASADAAEVRWYAETATTYYALDVQVSGSPRLRLRRVVAGASTTLATLDPAAFSLVPATDYKFRIETQNVAGPARQIRVYVDNNLAFDIVDAVATPGFGPYRVRGSSGAGAIVDNVESFRLPARFATIAPHVPAPAAGGGPPSDLVTRTSNFVQ